jgi:hypothetical protein
MNWSYSTMAYAVLRGVALNDEVYEVYALRGVTGESILVIGG